MRHSQVVPDGRWMEAVSVQTKRTGLWLVVWLVIFGAGCSGGAEEPSGGEGETGGGEEAGGGSSDYEGPIASTEVDRGKELFTSHCDDCHPGGEEDVGPSLIEEAHTPAQTRKQIREGSGKMRPFSEARLSNDDLEALLAYLASINAVK